MIHIDPLLNYYIFCVCGMIDFNDTIFIIGISHSARGYCINMVLETMKTYSSEDCLTEEAVVTKLRTRQYHHLFLHTSLRRNSRGSYFLFLFSLFFDKKNQVTL